MSFMKIDYTMKQHYGNNEMETTRWKWRNRNNETETARWKQGYGNDETIPNNTHECTGIMFFAVQKRHFLGSKFCATLHRTKFTMANNVNQRSLFDEDDNDLIYYRNTTINMLMENIVITIKQTTLFKILLRSNKQLRKTPFSEYNKTCCVVSLCRNTVNE